jgi:hypothetical protein
MTNPVLYYSHSWLAEHVDANLRIWNAVSGRFALRADPNVTAQGADPPYHVSRIEAHIRESDAFLALLLPGRGANVSSATEGDKTGAAYVGSAYTLFEVRLAERAGKPRLILYDAETRFAPSAESRGKNVQYLRFERGDLNNGASKLWNVVEEWMVAVSRRIERSQDIKDHQAAVLLPRHGTKRGFEAEIVRSALASTCLTEIVDVASVTTDVEAINVLQSCSILVADLSSRSTWDLYGLAHALFTPTIRLFQNTKALTNQSLPRSLRGHAAGYKDDLVRWSNATELRAALAERTEMICAKPNLITDLQTGQEFFEHRR